MKDYIIRNEYNGGFWSRVVIYELPGLVLEILVATFWRQFVIIFDASLDYIHEEYRFNIMLNH